MQGLLANKIIVTIDTMETNLMEMQMPEIFSI